MDVPFRLARRPTPAEADALLVFAADFAPLAAACARLGEAPGVYPVRGGFVLIAREPRALPGAVRLRRLAGDLFVPADADLLPALLPDEAVGLTRGRGLVLLPGGTVLAFAPDSPLEVRDWLAPAAVRRRSWRPFPERPDAADRLTRIEWPAPPVAVESIFAGGAPDDASPLFGDEGKGGGVPEEARPPAGAARDRLASGAKLGLAKAMAALAKLLRAPGLAKAAGRMARAAIERAPRLTEKLLGAQEAALRELLRQLQSGDVEKALRRAPAAVPDPDAGPAPVAHGADLNTHDVRYDLRSLLGGGGPGSVWLGGGNVWAELAREYRRLAQEAAARGDHRRAAYIYGVLLRDLRSAANALMAGGLYRDAALLFRDRLQDESSAATAFERAGDYDEAVRLYEGLFRYEQAGDLLRRIGDDERARGYFVRAADYHSGNGRFLAAGDLVRTKVGDRGAAAGYYRSGWDGGGADAIICGERLLDEHLVAEDWSGLDALVADAEAKLAPPRSYDAGRFFNYLMKLGDDFLPASLRADVADRTRMLFAAHVRPHAGAPGRAGELAGRLFGSAGPWPGPVVRDALFAARAPAGRPVSPPHPVSVRLADGTVTAVVVARDSLDLVVATTSVIICWRAADGRVVSVLPTGRREVLGLSVAPDGDTLYVLYSDGDGTTLRCFESASPGLIVTMGLADQGVAPDEPLYIQPSCSAWAGEPVVTLCVRSQRVSYRGHYLLAGTPREYAAGGEHTCLLASGHGGETWDWNEGFLWYRPGSPPSGPPVRLVAPWLPGVPEGSPLVVPPLDWVTPAPGILEAVGVDREGAMYWSEFDARDPARRQSRTATATHPHGYRAACLTAPGSVVAVTGQNEVLRFAAVGSVLKLRGAARRVDLPARAVFLAARRPANELVVVLDDGTAVRLPDWAS